MQLETRNVKSVSYKVNTQANLLNFRYFEVFGKFDESSRSQCLYKCHTCIEFISVLLSFSKWYIITKCHYINTMLNWRTWLWFKLALEFKTTFTNFLLIVIDWNLYFPLAELFTYLGSSPIMQFFSYLCSTQSAVFCQHHRKRYFLQVSRSETFSKLKKSRPLHLFISLLPDGSSSPRSSTHLSRFLVWLRDIH